MLSELFCNRTKERMSLKQNSRVSSLTLCLWILLEDGKVLTKLKSSYTQSSSIVQDVLALVFKASICSRDTLGNN